MLEAIHGSLALLHTGSRDGNPGCMRIERGVIASLDGGPRADDVIVDLRGQRILPGLINAHDHLQLNSLPRLKYREQYLNASEWIDDIRPRLTSDPLFLAHEAVPREERLLLGGVKNLLSGVTTVAHHDPLYPELLSAAYPIHVVTRYGWSHSLALDGAETVRRAFRQTPCGQPWIIHAGEGFDTAAAGEFRTLAGLGCIAGNTVLVHATAFSADEHRQVAIVGGGVVWCPTSNLHLFDRTIDVAGMPDRRHLVLGSDSRLSGGLDLLEEMRLAKSVGSLPEEELEEMVTGRAARRLGLPDRGALRCGMTADLIALPEGLALSAARRADITMVIVGGTPSYCDPGVAAVLPAAHFTRVVVDDHEKYLRSSLVSRLRDAHLQEPGLTFGMAPPGGIAILRRRAHS